MLDTQIRVQLSVITPTMILRGCPLRMMIRSETVIFPPVSRKSENYRNSNSGDP